jgi:hypothetical protein
MNVQTKMIAAIGVPAVMCLLIAFQRQTPPNMAPEFAVETVAGGLHVYSKPNSVSPNRFLAEDETVAATVTRVSRNLWKLELSAKQDLRTVTFPWSSHRAPLDDNISDDYFYYPYLLGITEKAAARNADWTWWGLVYPGEAFAPLVVLADNRKGRIVAAANWPPKQVKPMYAAERMILQYETGLRTGRTETYHAIIADVSGDADGGNPPWQLALDLYRSWLDSKIEPPIYPDWMWKGEGFLNIQLQNYRSFDINVVARAWDAVKNNFPWILFWGQMGADVAQGGGCCLLNQHMHPRYQPALTSWAAARAVEGNHVGYYSAPYHELGASALPLDTSAGVSYLSGWLAANRSYAANSFYIDTLARRYYGVPAAVTSLFSNGTISADSLVEGIVDIYPVASLVSGSLVGTAALCGAPYKRPQDAQTTTFPRFGRYLLGDRLTYEGSSNVDWRFWGGSRAWLQDSDSRFSSGCSYQAHCSSGKPCEYGTERLAFLLGAKIDLMDSDRDSILDAIVAERQRVHWWDRRPVYLDTRGLDLTGVSQDSLVEAARFRDRSGTDLVCISNPRHESGLFIGVGGIRVPVPTQAISILEIPNS